jgi:hypothetical protein
MAGFVIARPKAVAISVVIPVETELYPLHELVQFGDGRYREMSLLVALLVTGLLVYIFRCFFISSWLVFFEK